MSVKETVFLRGIIVGNGQSKTVFVRFTGTRVTSVKQYPQ